MIEQKEIDERLGHFMQAVRETGLRMTPQRMEIFKEVASSDAHPDAEAVYDAVRSRLPNVSLDTVYRTLSLLRTLKVICSVGIPHSNDRFDGNTSRHHHYVCVECGRIIDFRDSGLDALVIPESVASFGSIERAQVEVRGICAECTTKGRNGSDKESWNH